MDILLVKGDITKVAADAIVNAANTQLVGGGGVDGAIHNAGGPEIMKECDIIRKKQGGCPVGEAVITTAGNLPAKFVIHTVGPVWRGGNDNEEVLLRNAYINSLHLADQYELKSIVFPNISTGVYGYPKDKAARIAIDAINQFHSIKGSLSSVIFVCFDEASMTEYEMLLNLEK